jgi:hypothetical protein
MQVICRHFICTPLPLLVWRAREHTAVHPQVRRATASVRFDELDGSGGSTYGDGEM